MCGISGYFLKDQFSIDSIHKMIKAQIHRGPDFQIFGQFKSCALP